MSLQQLELSSEEHEHYGPLQQHHRVVASLNKQIQQKTKELGEVCRSLWFNECAVLNCVSVTVKQTFDPNVAKAWSDLVVAVVIVSELWLYLFLWPQLQAKHAEVKMGCDEDKRKLTEVSSGQGLLHCPVWIWSTGLPPTMVQMKVQPLNERKTPGPSNEQQHLIYYTVIV